VFSKLISICEIKDLFIKEKVYCLKFYIEKLYGILKAGI